MGQETELTPEQIASNEVLTPHTITESARTGAKLDDPDARLAAALLLRGLYFIDQPEAERIFEWLANDVDPAVARAAHLAVRSAVQLLELHPITRRRVTSIL